MTRFLMNSTKYLFDYIVQGAAPKGKKLKWSKGKCTISDKRQVLDLL